MERILLTCTGVRVYNPNAFSWPIEASPIPDRPTAQHHDALETLIEAATSVTVIHNWGHEPAGIVVLDQNRERHFPSVSYPDNNSITLTFAYPFTGGVYLS